MPSPTTARGLLGNFPRGADPPANGPRATTPPFLIADIFVLLVNIGGRGRGQEREGRSERPQGPEVGGEERRGGGG